MYMALKHSHMLFAMISVSLLLLRFGLSFTHRHWLETKVLKILPHVVDTLLLITAVGLMVTIAQYPFSSPWLTEKLIGLFAYIAMGFMALKGRTVLLRVLGLLGALGWIGMIVKVAITKTPVLFG